MPKYYIGQKVMLDGYQDTIVDSHWSVIQDCYWYTTLNGAEAIREADLERPPAKLEFGYCAVGDVMTDGEDDYPIMDVREKVFLVESPTNLWWATFEYVNNNGWKIKEEETPYEKAESFRNKTAQTLDTECWSNTLFGEETITLNGKTYKLVE